MFQIVKNVAANDVASAARRAANATFYQSHEGDEASALVYGLDMTELAYGASVEDFMRRILGDFRKDLHVAL